MATYIVSFEPASDQSAEQIREALKKYPSHCPINKYCWAIAHDGSANDVRDFLRNSAAGIERLFVIRSGTEAGWTNAYSDEHTAWLKTNL